MLMKKLLLSLFLLFFVSFSYADLKIVPQHIEATLKPDAPLEGFYSLTNNYDGDVTVDVSASFNRGWSYKKNADIPLESWLKVTPSKLKIKQGETGFILYSIKPNPGMQGSVAGQVNFKVNPPSAPTVNVVMSLPIHIIMQGTEKIEYGIDSLSVNPSKKLDIGIKNEGNIIIHPVGTVDIYDGSKKIKSVQLLETVSVFPETIRKDFSVELPSGLKPGKYTAKVTIELIGYKHFVKPAVKSIKFRVLPDGRII